jgi:putative transposase
MTCRRRTIRQHELGFQTWGGARRGAGRKRSSPRSRIPHVARPRHDARTPLHVTLRLCDGVPSLRRSLVRERVFRALGDGRERFGFRLHQFSLQSNHIHLIVEADDGRALSRGMKGIAVRVARTMNRLWRRKGSVFSDRFHARPLRTPREVRSALVYVLQNARHHGLSLMGVDPYSSGPWFDGWRQGIVLAGDGPGTRARTWLLREGWRRHGLIGIQESPGGPRGSGLRGHRCRRT